MSRGGERRGSGRKPGSVHSFGQMMMVGARCEWLQNALAEKRSEDIRQKITACQREQLKTLRGVPILLRKRWLESHSGKEYVEDMDLARREDQGLDLAPIEPEEPIILPPGESEPNRFILVEASAWGARKNIIHRVSKYYDLNESTVERFWKLFRRMQARVPKRPDQQASLID